MPQKLTAIVGLLMASAAGASSITAQASGIVFDPNNTSCVVEIVGAWSSTISGCPIFESTLPLDVAARSVVRGIGGGGTGKGGVLATQNLDQVHLSLQANQPGGLLNQIYQARLSLTATTNYEVMVVGKLMLKDIIKIPILVHTSGTADCSGLTLGAIGSSIASSFALVNIGGTQGFGGNTANYKVDCDIGTGPNSFDAYTRLAFQLNVATRVEMSASGTVTSGGFVQFGLPPSGSFAAFADPTFQIDPAFPFADNYQIITSFDGANSIPEPGAGLLFAIGLTFLMIRMRRDRRQPADEPEREGQPE